MEGEQLIGSSIHHTMTLQSRNRSCAVHVSVATYETKKKKGDENKLSVHFSLFTECQDVLQNVSQFSEGEMIIEILQTLRQSKGSLH